MNKILICLFTIVSSVVIADQTFVSGTMETAENAYCVDHLVLEKSGGANPSSARHNLLMKAILKCQELEGGCKNAVSEGEISVWRVVDNYWTSNGHFRCKP